MKPYKVKKNKNKLMLNYNLKNKNDYSSLIKELNFFLDKLVDINNIFRGNAQ